MNPWAQAGLTIVGALVLAWLAYRAGQGGGRRQAEEAQERLLRLDPPDRTSGLPTNLGVEPSRPRTPRWRSGRFDGNSQL